jgi:hypothetical protein
MITMRQLDRIGMGQPEAALPAELLSGRAEDCLALQRLIQGSPVMAAAYAILRAGELGQSHRALVQQATLRLMQIQSPDGGWGAGGGGGGGVATTAVALKALADQGAWTRESVARARAGLEKQQLASGGYGSGAEAVVVTALVLGMLCSLREVPVGQIQRAADWLKSQAAPADVAPLVGWAIRQARRVLEAPATGVTSRRRLWDPQSPTPSRESDRFPAGRAEAPPRDAHRQGLLWAR